VFAISYASTAYGLDQFKEKDDLREYTSHLCFHEGMNMTCLMSFRVYKSTVKTNLKCGLKEMTKMLLKGGVKCDSFYKGDHKCC
jgi:hypothetical protein